MESSKETVIDCTAKVTLTMRNSFDNEGELKLTVLAHDSSDVIYGWLTPETAKKVIDVLTNALDESGEVSG